MVPIQAVITAGAERLDGGDGEGEGEGQEEEGQVGATAPPGEYAAPTETREGSAAATPSEGGAGSRVHGGSLLVLGLVGSVLPSLW
jgi:hypothetical protein